MPEYTILQAGVDHVVSVAGSGSRITPLIAKGPKRITCVDVLREQLDLTELRVEAIRQLNYHDFMTLFGYPEGEYSPGSRRQIFESLSLDEDISYRIKPFLTAAQWEPIIYLGEFERMLQTISRLMRLIIGDRMDAMFGLESLEEQRAFIASKRFPRKRWLLALKLFGNTTAFNMLLFRSDFPKKNLEGPTWSHYQRMFTALLDNVLVRDSYFFQLLILGKLVNSTHCILEANEAIFNAIKSNLAYTEVAYCQGDILSDIQQVEEPVDLVSISDVPSFLPDDIAQNFLQHIKHKVKSGGTVISRGHLRVISPDSSDYLDVTKDLTNPVISDRTSLWTINVYKKL